MIFFPAKTASDLFSLDNGFFAQLKTLLKRYPLGTFQQKQSTIELVMEDIAPETIQKYFVHCGLCHVEDYVVEDSDCFHFKILNFHLRENLEINCCILYIVDYVMLRIMLLKILIVFF